MICIASSADDAIWPLFVACKPGRGDAALTSAHVEEDGKEDEAE